MAFNTFETSLEGGVPIEIFEFTLGSTFYRWTSAVDDQSVGGNTYTAAEITRSRIVDGKDDRDGIIEILVPSTNVLAQQYIPGPPTNKATVKIQKFHRGDSGNTVTIWEGVVEGVMFFDQNEQAKIECRPSLGTVARLMPRFMTNVQCDNQLYDNVCGVSRASFRHTAVVSSVSSDGRTLTVPGLLAAKVDADWAVGGYVQLGDDKRMIFTQSGDDVTIHLPFRTSPNGQSVDVQAGCDHSAATCKAKFNNLPRFRGFPFAPEGPEGDIWQNGLV